MPRLKSASSTIMEQSFTEFILCILLTFYVWEKNHLLLFSFFVFCDRKQNPGNLCFRLCSQSFLCFPAGVFCFWLLRSYRHCYFWHLQSCRHCFLCHFCHYLCHAHVACHPLFQRVVHGLHKPSYLLRR